MNDHQKTWAQEIYLSLVIGASTLAVTYAVAVASQEKSMTFAELVNAYMAAQMKVDPVLASTFLGPDFEIMLSGGRKMKDPVEASEHIQRAPP